VASTTATNQIYVAGADLEKLGIGNDDISVVAA
jgi:hypothetical protein